MILWFTLEPAPLVHQIIMRLTYDLPAHPVVCVIKRVSFAFKQLSEQGPQVLVVRLFKEIQPPDVAQIRSHLFWKSRAQDQSQIFSFLIRSTPHSTKQLLSRLLGEKTNMTGNTKGKNNLPGKFSQRTSIGVFRFVSPIFWYLSFNVSAWKVNSNGIVFVHGAEYIF